MILMVLLTIWGLELEFLYNYHITNNKNNNDNNNHDDKKRDLPSAFPKNEKFLQYQHFGKPYLFYIYLSTT